MKITSETLDILKAIININSKSPVNGACFKAGSRIKVRRYKSDMPIMYANITEIFDKDFAVYDLPKFVSLFSVLEDPEITFEDNFILFKSGKKQAKLRYVSPNLIESDQGWFSKEIKMPSRDFNCILDKSTFKSILDASSMFQSPQIAFIGDGNKVTLTTYNIKDPKADKLEIIVGESSWEFNVIIDISLLQFPKRDYEVTISKKGLIEWKSDNLTFYITMSDKSKV